MSIVKDTTRAIRMTLVLWVLSAIIYPLLMIIVGQVFFPFQANGSIVQNPQGQPVGSALIGQAFTSEQYFITRPSTVEYSIGEDAAPTGISGASNLAPSNPELIKRIHAEVEQLQQIDILPTADLIYTSGSGLDPHITVAAANAQVQRVARVRALPPDQIRALITENTDGKFLEIFGEPGVNVFQLNLALDTLKSGS
ncbi:K(+)-transporting ATPase subunit C [Gloeocapsopsis dulcis]|uniref:Potassium-transporting ATPase KdpC subunit n=1 Tax=Gloeocapsopsis dulcis AAB1 = 1H9 TaxID=1433147 RepID=A0A6N8FX00_9CHRO|nr:K(+)-transporting ATPase subunit C [Gloeocapsopsis dulcis]MUL36677.1 potassium-transporting ATPase subunit C [Gloeocapsopsis dulcis AAB1 = 1H9]WNN91252.1 K(+)-transporting ATPase subunit C [Gloeocapsopsis dulcis]